MAKRIKVTDNGIEETEIPDGTSVLPQRAGDVAPVSNRPSAAARLAKSRSGQLARGENLFEEFITRAGEVFYIKRLTWPQATRVHMEAGLATGILNLEDGDENFTAFTASSLEACVYFEPSEDAKYFTQVSAMGWASSQDDEIAPLAGELSNACLNFNKMLVPQFIRTREALAPSSLNENQPSPVASEPSSSSTSTSTETHGTPTDSSAPPATSPSTSEAEISSTPTSTESHEPSSE